jgi:hypothetical protein
MTVDKYYISKLWARDVFLEARKEKEGRACVLK